VCSATEVYARVFDSVFFKLPAHIREAIERKIHHLGSRLGDCPHQRLTGRVEYRLRIGDYRVIYEFNLERNILYLSPSAIEERSTVNSIDSDARVRAGPTESVVATP
jgi:mRNA-degrading endonuclease RelE of RelBE toxin-antitoxin system